MNKLEQCLPVYLSSSMMIFCPGVCMHETHTFVYVVIKERMISFLYELTSYTC